MKQSQQIHASAAMFGGKVVLILGQSGSGKSALLLQLMAQGFTLVADDIVLLVNEADGILATAPANADGRFEIRHIGIFKAKTTASGFVELVIDLDEAPKSRLPETSKLTFFHKKVLKIDGKGLINLAEYIKVLFSGEISFIDPDT